jgi:hypothetical protein
MTDSDVEADLMESRQVVLVLRLTLDGNSQLLYGELLNAEGVGQGRFIDLMNLSNMVMRWLGRQHGARAHEADEAT